MDRLSILTKYLTFVMESAFPIQAKEMQLELRLLKPRKERPPDPISLDLETGKWSGITEQDLSRWARLFPGVSIHEELLKAARWGVAHPERKKLYYSAFLAKWFTRSFNEMMTTRRKGQGAFSESAEERAIRRASLEP